MKLGPLLSCLVAVAICLGCSTNKDEAPATSESPVNGVPIGEVRGVVDLSNTLRARLFDDADPMTPSFDVSRVAGPVFRLRKQLGVFALEGTSTTYQGGLPTPLRMTLWHQIFGRTATALGDVCTQPDTAALTFVAYAANGAGTSVRPTTFRLYPSVADRIAKTCTFEGDQPARRATAGAFFDAVMGLGSSLAADKEAFLTEFAADGSHALTESPQARVTNMSLAMLLNPHFLLAK